MRIWAWCGVGVVLWLAVVALTILDGLSHSAAAASRLDELQNRESLSVDQLEDVVDELSAAAADLSEAEDAFSNPAVLPLRYVPIAGRHLRSAATMLGAGRELIDASVSAAEALEAVQATPDNDRVTAMRAAASALSDLSAVATAVDLGSDDALRPELIDARERLEAARIEVAELAGHGSVVLAGLSNFFESSDVVLLAANNAEMQLGSGMPLAIGRLEVRNGDVRMTSIGHAFERFPVVGVEEADPDFLDRWGFVSPLNDWRKLALSPRFDEVGGPLALQMWQSQESAPVDSVLLLDVVALAGLRDALALPALDENGDLLDVLLVDQYASAEGETGNSDRRDRLTEFAADLAQSLPEVRLDEPSLVGELSALGAGRHMMLFSEDAAEQEAWERLGFAGSVEATNLGVHLLNIGASKLDPFVFVEVEALPSDAGVSLQISIQNDTPATVSDIAAGPWRPIGLASAGTYLGRLAIVIPAGVTSAGFQPERSLEVFGPDGDVGVAAGRIEVAPGDGVVLRFDLEIPASGAPSRWVIMPDGRSEPVAWTWFGEPVVQGDTVDPRAG